MQGSSAHESPDLVQLPSFATLLASIAPNFETGHARRPTTPPMSLMGQTPITPPRHGVTYAPHSTPRRASTARNSETNHAHRPTTPPPTSLLRQIPITPPRRAVPYTPPSTPRRASRDARSDYMPDLTLQGSASRAARYKSRLTRLMSAIAGAPDERFHSRRSSWSASGSNKQISTRPRIDWARVMPGQMLRLLDVDLVNTVVPLSTTGVRVELLCCPRAAEFCTDAEYVIEFVVRDMPGPSIQLLAAEGCDLDEASEEVFKPYGLNKAKFRFEWLGLLQFDEPIRNASKATRAQLASYIAVCIIKAFMNLRDGKTVQVLPAGENGSGWDLLQINMHKLRLFSLNYYRQSDIWIPILGYEVVVARDH